MRSLIVAEFFTNIIRSILLISFSKYLYDYTGQLWSFALVFVVDSFVSFIIPLYAGKLVDILGSSRILHTSSICLSASLTSGFIYASVLGTDTQILLTVAILFNVITPFIRMSVFTITPELISKSKLASANSMLQISVQSGQLAGLFIVAIIMIYYEFKEILAVATLAAIVSLVFYKSAYRLLSSDKKQEKLTGISEVIASITNKPIVFLLMASSIDMALVSFFNLFLSPWVAEYYNNQPEYFSIIDGLFAIGAIVAGILGAKYFNNSNVSPWVAVASQIFAFITFFLYSSETLNIIRYGSIILFGVFCTLSVIYFNTLIHKYTPTNIKGRLVGVRRLCISIYVTIGSFIISSAHSIDYSYAINIAVLITIVNTLFLIYWIAYLGEEKSIEKLSAITVT
jgi:MFS family permease